MKKSGKILLLSAMTAAMLCSGMTGCGTADSKTDFQSDSNFVAENVDEGFSTGGADKYKAEVAAYEEAPYEESAAGKMEDADSESKPAATEAVKNTVQKIIKRYNYSYETEEFDKAYAYLKEQIEEYQGYITSSNIEGTSYRSLYLTARIPAGSSDDFVSRLGNIGTVISQSETAEDVTLQYTDTESRIASLKIEQERLNDLLEKADSLETIIALEERLTEVRYELENYQSKKNLYDDLISYSTIDITLEEVTYTVPVDDSTFVSRILTGLEASFRNIKNDFVDFLVWLIVSLPYIIIWGVILLVIIKIIRIFIRKKRNKKEKMKIKETISEQIKE